MTQLNMAINSVCGSWATKLQLEALAKNGDDSMLPANLYQVGRNGSSTYSRKVVMEVGKE